MNYSKTDCHHKNFITDDPYDIYDCGNATVTTTGRLQLLLYDLR